MDTTEGITWTSKKEWGAVGLTHRATVTVDGIVYHFVIDQPSKGDWVVRGWKDGDFFFYRDRATARTLAAMKDLVADVIGDLRLSAAADGYGELDTAEAKSEVRDSEPEHAPLDQVVLPEGWTGMREAFAGLNLFIVALADEMRGLLDTLRGHAWHTCSCPTPTHRMNCGVGATPKVVVK